MECTNVIAFGDGRPWAKILNLPTTPAANGKYYGDWIELLNDLDSGKKVGGYDKKGKRFIFNTGPTDSILSIILHELKNGNIRDIHTQ